jgi:hypothetical protein
MFHSVPGVPRVEMERFGTLYRPEKSLGPF